MEPRERFDDHQGALRAAMDGRQAQMWTALPAIVDSVSLGQDGHITCTATPAVQVVYVDPTGKRTNLTIGTCQDVPICYPRGGGYTLTFPVAKGDECLLVFSSRCIDNWWQEGGIQPQFEHRMHDLSDGFALVGPFSQKTRIANVNTTTTQLRSDDGKQYVEIDTPNKKINVITPQTSVVLDEGNDKVTTTAGQTSATVDGAGGIVDIVAPTKIVLDSPLLEITGVLHATRTKGTGKTATISGDVQIDSGSVAVTGGGITSSADQVAGTISQQNHTHPDPQGGNTGRPT